MDSRFPLAALLLVLPVTGSARAQDPLHRDHENGSIYATVTSQGILGREAEGLQYPGRGFGEEGQLSALWIGSFWAAIDTNYVLNRDYFADPVKEWEPLGGVRVTDTGEAPSEFESCASDSGHAAPRGLHLRLRSRMWDQPGSERFVLLNYTLENRGATTLQDLYGGLFVDLDLGGGAADSTFVEADNRLIYIYDIGLDPPAGTAGLVLLGETVPSNLTVLRNEDYVHLPIHSGYVLDPVKVDLLKGDLRFDAVSGDGSMLAAYGPITLGPGETHDVAFALIHEHGEAAFRTAALAAAERWHEIRVLRGELAARATSWSELKSRY